MKNNLPQDIETRLTVAEGLCKLFQKKNKEKVDQFKPIYKQTDINNKLTLIIDGTPYEIDGVHISHRYMPEEYFEVTVKFDNDELKKKFMSQFEATNDTSKQLHKWDIVYGNVLLNDSDDKSLIDCFNVFVTSIDLGSKETYALLYMDYWKLYIDSGSKYEKQLFDDLSIKGEEFAYVEKARLEQMGWYAECDD